MEILKNNRYIGLWIGIFFFILLSLVSFWLNSHGANDWLRTLNTIGIFAILALSLNVILGQTGLFNMGHAAFFALGAYVTGILNTSLGLPIIYTLPIAACIAGAFALLVILPVIHLRGDYLLVVTIGIGEILRIALINDIFGLTQGPNGITAIKRFELFGFKFTSQYSQFWLIWAFVAFTALLFYLLEHSRFGRALNYIKYDEVAASGNGINIVRYKLLAFAVGAFWAGIAGAIYAPFIRTISPGLFGFNESIVLFAIVVLAGGGNIIGVVIATFLLVGFKDFLTKNFGDWSMLIFGAMMMIIMILRPQGIMHPRRRRYKARDLVGKFASGIKRSERNFSQDKVGEK
ncbi:branched-chain amino acid ABC transporter permease (plasmid) [Bartonella sp. HY329]|uniref:branched-chain amino acid ABC transporter permease n=1 Tax=unclassified Bartonella TaxID=2645622 RepID=UPI0021C59A84|nr:MULTISPECIES: branched-chain amino acid ABC transporter permease [unclassified Bartonella]UXM96535.1 branched-chain amino acid ABC transporter permease [Bartonella sp. HY329]UXN10858.1 branched-chain amino acid ABC transporter permease [Bartonella sp. HY328]